VVQKTSAGDHEIAGVTVFSQLHCLHIIRAAIQDPKAGKALGMDIMKKRGMRRAGDTALFALPDYPLKGRIGIFFAVPGLVSSEIGLYGSAQLSYCCSRASSCYG
jgi:hypothetical protein